MLDERNGESLEYLNVDAGSSKDSCNVSSERGCIVSKEIKEHIRKDRIRWNVILRRITPIDHTVLQKEKISYVLNLWFIFDLPGGMKKEQS